ncbi:hypothetical protein CAEBREN_18746 [Caenorhabditis brenneri]|uniref:F-box domain-containing protein n=1 Tax=Caenorhabditis brenneri TaxID=135651 RepID=G0N3X4_CAEBE|nr:hypothetical protein CAEBREN_18746 [Caenorhabditis brenneri]
MATERCQLVSVEGCTTPVFESDFKLTIPFHRLPLLVQVQVVQIMRPKDWINLAMTSKRNERVVKLARITTEYPCIQFCQDACIRMSSLKLDLFVGSSCVETDNWDMMTKEDMKTWLNEPNTSMIENAAKLYEKLQNFFVFERYLEINFCTDIAEKATIGELLSNPALRDWVTLSITGKTISSEDLEMIMNKLSYRGFECKVEEMPLDFKHENAFKFVNQRYHDSRWVQIEDLYVLKNSCNVTLLRNNFTREQIKSFVNYWVNSEVDMFMWMKIEMKYVTNFGILLDGFFGLRCKKLNNMQFFMLSKTTSTSRKYTMLAISYIWNSLTLTAWGEDENYEFYDNEDYNKPFRNCRVILTKLQEKKELEDLQKVGSEEEKIELEGRIEDVVAELKQLQVVFRNGNAWLI